MKKVIIFLSVLAVTLAGVICWNISGTSKGNNTNTVSDAAGQPGEAALTGEAEGGRTVPTAAPSEPAVSTPSPTAGGDNKPTVTGVIDDPVPTVTEPIAQVTAVPAEMPVRLLISEILPTNTKYNKHNNAYHDAIEIYNASEEPVMLSDYCLSDSKKKLANYPLPEVELPAGGYAVFYCTGEYEAKGEYDLPFKLSYFGEKVFLGDREGNVLDKVEYPEMPQNVSYGRDGDEFRIYSVPSLGKANEGGNERFATMPETDLAPGFYKGAQKVSFTTEGTIRYTLDGSKPDSNSKKWDGTPIEINSSCTIRAYATEENCMASFDVAFNYVIDAPDYELDVVMVSLKKSDFDTMNANYNSRKKYAANISLFTSGNLEFSVDCAISTHGATSRAYPKKSYQITFSTTYGPSKLQYKLFDDLDIDEFNSIVLRSGSQDNSGAIMRDEYVTSLATSYGVVDDVLVQAYRPVNLYVNGQYWGIYYIREHIDADMIASHYDCDPEEVTLIKQMRSVKCGNDAQEWLDLWKYISNNRIKDAEAYEYVSSVVDVRSVADYYIIQLWNGNIDMDNVRVCKAGGKWIFILYDLDLTLVRAASGTTQNQLGVFNTGYYTFNALINRLLEYGEFRELFMERMSLLFTTVLSTDSALTLIDRFESALEHDMEYNCARWAGTKDPLGKIGYVSFKTWRKCVESLRGQVRGREWKILKDFTKTKNIPSELVEKYFPMLDK